MKPKNKTLIASTVTTAALIVAFNSNVQAATINKANNADSLNLASSWSGGVVPGVGDIAQWTGLSGANSVSLGGNLSWQGITIQTTGGLVTIGAGNTLTLGTSGIDMSAASQNLTINSALALGVGNQTWNVATGRTLTVGGAISRSTGSTLLIDKTSNTGTVTASPTLTNGVLPWAIVKSAGTAANNTAAGYNFATVSGGNIVAYTGATAVTTSYPASNATANYDWSANGTQAQIGSSRSANTIRYTGTGVTQLTNSAQTETFNALMNAGTGTVNLGGGSFTMSLQSAAGVNELVLAAMSSGININGRIINNGANAGAVTILGAGSNAVALTGTSTFTGATNVNSGTLLVSGTGSINTTSSITVNGGKYLHTSSVASTRTITLNGGTVDGTGTLGIINVADNASSIVTNGNGGTSALTIGTLAFGGDAAMNLNLGSGVGLAVTDTLSTTPANGTVTVNATKSSWTIGSNSIVSYGSFGGSGSDFSIGTITGLSGRQTASSVSASGGFLSLNVIGDLPVWSGTSSGNWTTATTGDNTGSNNWATKSGLTATNFWVSDTAEFNDTYNVGGGPVAVTNRTVDIQSANVNPVSVTFNNSAGDYTLNSSGGFGITSGSLAKSGSSALTINSANTYAGGTTLNAGTLNVNNAGALGTGAVTINGGTLDNTSGGAITLSANNTQTWNSDVAFTGSNDLNMGTGNVTLTGDTRTVTVNAGTLTTGKFTSAVGGLTKNGNGTLQLAPTGVSSITGSLRVNAGTFGIGSQDFTATGLAGSGTIQNGSATTRWLFVNNATDQTFDGVLQNGGTGRLGLNKSGAGTLTLNGPNSYSDVTTLAAGTLVLGNISALGATSVVNVSNGTTLRYATDGGDTAYATNFGTGTTFNVILDRASAGGSVTHAMGAATYGGGTVNFTAGSNLTSGTASVTYSSLSLTAGTTQTTLFNPGNNTNVSIGSVTIGLNNQSKTLGLGGTTTGNEVTGAISNGVGTVSVNKSNTSTWTISGSSSYTGTTTVSDGTLVINGNISTSSLTTVSGGTLKGSGVVGDLAATGGVIAPGNSIESLGVGDLTIGSAATFAYELDTLSLDGDLLYSGGALGIGSGATLTLSELASGTLSLGSKLTLISYTGVWDGGTFSGYGDDSTFSLGSNLWTINYNDISGGSNFSADQAGATGFVTMTVVPEPGAVLLGGLGMLCLLRRRR